MNAGTDTRSTQHSVPIADEEPLHAHAVLVTLFSAAAAAVLATASRRGSQRIGLGDLVLGAVATQRLSRLLTKDRVTSGLRAPFARRRTDDDGLPGEVEDTPAGAGLRLAIGQLLTCPYCVAQWVSLGFVAGFSLAPRQTRLVAATLAITSAADLAQATYVRQMAEAARR